jgi:hypothetical protein
VDLGFAMRPQPHQLGAVPDQLTQLPGLGWRDPGLRQSAHLEQIGQVRRVAQVVLHPPVLEGLDPQRMRQVHVRTRSRQSVHCPIPAISRLKHDLGRLAGPFHHGVDPVDVIHNLNRLQHLAGLRGPNQDATTAMKIDADDLPACVL